MLIDTYICCICTYVAHSYIDSQVRTDHCLFQNSLGGQGPAHAQVATRIAWISPVSKREYPGSLFESPSVISSVNMERFLRSWRQDALNRGQHDSAIYIGDKVLALTSKDYKHDAHSTVQGILTCW